MPLLIERLAPSVLVVAVPSLTDTFSFEFVWATSHHLLMLYNFALTTSLSLLQFCIYKTS
jgi:hypothetical protein